MSTHSLTGKIALVTGGGRSLGRDISLRLADAGADVILTYRSNEAAANDTAQAIRERGQRAHVLQVELNGTQHLDAFVIEFKQTLTMWGTDSFDILVHNAGVGGGAPLPHVNEDWVDDVFNTNYKSVFFLTQKLEPLIRNEGRIFTIGSGLTRFTFDVYAVYASLKGAVELLARHWAKTLGPRAITVNAVSPGALDTDFNAQAFDAHPEMRDLIAQNTALGRVGLAGDVGGVVAFLCTDDARWITGQRIEVSGGMFL